MKAKIKKTGEIVNLASYATITLDQCDSWGNPIELKPEEVELIPNVTEDEHWQDVRERAAIAAMQSLLANTEIKISYGNYGDTYFYHDDGIADLAVCYANALVEQLKKK
jgi:hypothetical protein